MTVAFSTGSPLTVTTPETSAVSGRCELPQPVSPSAKSPHRHPQVSGLITAYKRFNFIIPLLNLWRFENEVRVSITAYKGRRSEFAKHISIVNLEQVFVGAVRRSCAGEMVNVFADEADRAVPEDELGSTGVETAEALPAILLVRAE